MEASRHCCGSGEIKTGLLREQTVLRQWGTYREPPAGADTTAAVGKIEKAPAGSDTPNLGKYRQGSCESRHFCGSGEI